jgi:hypothetical protein
VSREESHSEDCGRIHPLLEPESTHNRKMASREVLPMFDGVLGQFALEADPKTPPVPLRATHELDGYGHSACGIYFSDHAGLEALNPWVVKFFGEEDPSMGWTAENLALNGELPWCVPTMPVGDDATRDRLGHGEACFNIKKFPKEYRALLNAGIVTDTGRTYQQGYYPPFPIAKINLPAFMNNDEMEQVPVPWIPTPPGSVPPPPPPPAAAAPASEMASMSPFEAEQRDPLGLHRWVRLVNLSATAMNGKLAEVIFPLNADTGRVGVRLAGEALVSKAAVGREAAGKVGKPVAIKPANLEPLSDAESVKVCRLEAAGEDQTRCKRALKVQTTRWPKELLAAAPFDESPLSQALGFGPLRITRVAPRSKLTEREHYDNQWTTYMMIEPVSGLAPPPWQSSIGAVVAWRESGAPVSADDMCLFNDYLSNLLDRYSDARVDPGRDFTPAKWLEEKNLILARMMGIAGYDDINI